MEEELYEELPGGEDIYESLPEGPYDDDPCSSPPPLPTAPIPTSAHPSAKVPPLPTRSSNTGGAPTPPPPIRSSATSVTYKAQTLPRNLRQTQEQDKVQTATKPGKKPPPPKSKGPTGAGGIDMSEILKKARQKDTSALLDLEARQQHKEETHIVPWANQLRKTLKPTSLKEELPKETGEDEVPEFIRQAKQIHTQRERSESMSSLSSPPPVLAKPLKSVPTDRNDGSSTSENKPPWVLQRERQQHLARTVGMEKTPPPGEISSAGDTSNQPPVSPKPKVGPRPTVPKPGTGGSLDGPVPRVPRPNFASRPPPDTPAPPPPSETPSPPHTPISTNEKPGGPANVPPLAQKPYTAPRPPIKEKPATFEKPAIPPPVPTRETSVIRKGSAKGEPSPPEPMPRRDSLSKFRQPPPPMTKPPGPPQMMPTTPSREMPPPPSTRPPPPPDSPPPDIPPPEGPPLFTAPSNIPPHDVHPPDMPPPPLSPPPPSEPPPTFNFAPPRPPKRDISKFSTPSPSHSPLPPQQGGIATRGQPTPLTRTVTKFRRVPLRSVDLLSPPPLPDRNTKPSMIPAFAASSQITPTENGIAPSESNEYDDEPEELYEDVVKPATVILSPLSKPPFHSYSPSKPAPPPPPSASSSNPSRPPPIPAVEEERADEVEDMYEGYNVEETTSLQNGVHNGRSSPQDVYEELPLSADAPPLSSLPSQTNISQGSISPNASPSLERKQKLSSKEQKRLQKEEEIRDKAKKRQEKEREKQEKEREKERKRKEDQRAKNRAKSLKTYKEFKLPSDVQSLFSVEVLLDHTKTKDHMSVTTGEICFVLLIDHPKLPKDRYFVEKEDGTMGFVKKNIVERTVYQSTKSVLVESEAPQEEYPAPEDLYESVCADSLDGDPSILPPPSLPPYNTTPSHESFPPPSHPPPRPPS